MEEEKICAFQRELRAQGAAPQTIRSYTSAVRLYFSLHSSLTLENLKEFQEYLLTHYSAATVNARIHGLNRYIRMFGMEEEAGSKDYHLPSVRLQRRSFLEHVISQEDYHKLRTGLWESRDLFWYFILRFLGSTGARVSELLQIKAEHVQLGYMDLRSKGGKIRRIYFPEELCREAEEWLNSRKIRSGFLFVKSDGKVITQRAVRLHLKVIARRYGVAEETVYPHAFRHRFAKNFLERFNDIALLADLLGHESIETTRIYLTRSSEEQQELIDRIVTW